MKQVFYNRNGTRYKRALAWGTRYKRALAWEHTILQIDEAGFL